MIEVVIIGLFIAQAVQPARRLLPCNYQGCLGDVTCSISKAELSEMRLDVRTYQIFWGREIVKGLVINMTNKRPVM